MIFTPLGHRIIVRFARKPIWMPTARSKLFRIPEHTFYSSEEMKRIFKLFDSYNAQMSAIREYMRHEFYIPATQSGGLPKEFLEKEQELDREILRENDQLNAEIAAQRAEYFSSRIKHLTEKTLLRKQEIEQELLENAVKIDEILTKSDSNSYITPDNIDEMIEKAIENPTIYEFCIDTFGRKYGPAANRVNTSQE